MEKYKRESITAETVHEQPQITNLDGLEKAAPPLRGSFIAAIVYYFAKIVKTEYYKSANVQKGFFEHMLHILYEGKNLVHLQSGTCLKYLCVILQILILFSLLYYTKYFLNTKFQIKQVKGIASSFP